MQGRVEWNPCFRTYGVLELAQSFWKATWECPSKIRNTFIVFDPLIRLLELKPRETVQIIEKSNVHKVMCIAEGFKTARR